MDPRIRRLADVPPQPWRNGLGVTRELLALPGATHWHVRVSVADVTADGPFSGFPEVRRWFAVIEGAGVELDIAGVRHRVTTRTDPLPFDGGAPTGCRLIDGPTRDLNLMLKGVPGALHIAQAGLTMRPAHRACGLFVRKGGCCVADTRRIELEPLTLIWFDEAPTALRFEPDTAGPGRYGWWIDAGVAPGPSGARSNPAR